MTVGQELADKASLHHPFNFHQTCPVSFCSMSRNAQGERLPELAEELEKLRAGLAVEGDQAWWKYLRPRCIGCNCAYVTYVSICFWWRLWGSQDTIQVKMPRFTKNLLEVGRSLADVFARNPEIIWVQRPELVVKHAWTCEQRFFLKTSIMYSMELLLKLCRLLTCCWPDVLQSVWACVGRHEINVDILLPRRSRIVRLSYACSVMSCVLATGCYCCRSS